MYTRSSITAVPREIVSSPGLDPLPGAEGSPSSKSWLGILKMSWSADLDAPSNVSASTVLKEWYAAGITSAGLQSWIKQNVSDEYEEVRTYTR